MRKFKEWHTNFIRNYMKQLNIGIFGLAWLSWSKGVIMTLILMLLTSCASFQLTTLNHDPMYPDEMKVDVIDNEFQLARKLRTDDRFRWDFAQYAMNQDMRWNYDFYFNNRMHRSGFGSPFAFHWNSHQYWWNWANNSNFNMGFNHWDTFGFYGNGYSMWNNYGMYGYGWNNGYYGNGWNNGYYNGWYGNGWGNRDRMNDYAWNNRSRENVSYNIGRRGSSNVVSNRTIENKIIVNRNNPRIVNNPDVVIDRELIKLKRNNPNIRVIRNTNNNNSKPIINYNRIENNSNNNINRNNNNTRPINNSRPVRTYTPPTRSSTPVIRTTPVRTNGNTNVVRGGNSNVKR